MYKAPEFNHVNLRDNHPFLSMMGNFELEKAAQIIWDEYKKSLKTEWHEDEFNSYAFVGFREWTCNPKYFSKISQGKYVAKQEFFDMVEQTIKKVNPKYLNGN